MPICKKAIDLIIHFESIHDGDLTKIGLQPKMDPIGIWTEGYGRAMIDPATKGHLRGIRNKERAYALASIKTQTDALNALLQDATRLGVTPAKRVLGVDSWDLLTPEQQGALVSFVYNCGTHNIATRQPYLIFNNINRWVAGTMTNTQLKLYWQGSVIKAGGVILRGLEIRRKAEAVLFLEGRLQFTF